MPDREGDVLTVVTCVMSLIRDFLHPDLPNVAVQEARYRHSSLCTGDWRHASLHTGHQQWPHTPPSPRVSRVSRVDLRQTRHVSSRWPGLQTVGDSVNISSPARRSRMAVKYLVDNMGCGYTQYVSLYHISSPSIFFILDDAKENLI